MDKAIVITGSTRGIGLGLAEAFLKLGCLVVISGRNQASVDCVVETLANTHPADSIAGIACDVRDHAQVQALWDAACARFGRIDIWINNAGIAHPQMPIHAYPAETLASVVETNVIGMLNGVQVASQRMLAQGQGSIYNMHGLGSDGRKIRGLAVYGSTKQGLRYLTDSLIQEMRGTPILVGSINPGMVATELLLDQFEDRPEEWEQAKRIFNILTDRVETVTPWLAEQVLRNRKHGVSIRWMSPWKLMMRFLSAPFVHRGIVDQMSPGRTTSGE
ncbi:MAG: SDR family oxidoreductase [Anaerolineales bacterium]|nr:SDR family oxidoreductase [Anaerolineales bacterium]